MYLFGTCSLHPELRCFHYRHNDWHFDLDSNRLRVWANSIVSFPLPLIKRKILKRYLQLCKTTTYEKIPLGSNFFHPKNRIGGDKLGTTQDSAQAPCHAITLVRLASQLSTYSSPSSALLRTLSCSRLPASFLRLPPPATSPATSVVIPTISIQYSICFVKHWPSCWYGVG